MIVARVGGALGSAMLAAGVIDSDEALRRSAQRGVKLSPKQLAGTAPAIGGACCSSTT
jgi:hypothetical protein